MANLDINSIPNDEKPIKLEVDEEVPVKLIPDKEPSKEITYEEDEPISLVDEGEATRQVSIKHKSKDAGGYEEQLTRPLIANKTGATRCKIFHSKISLGALEGMEKQINEWSDSNPDIEIKNVGHVIGTLQGKSNEDNVIVLCWY